MIKKTIIVLLLCAMLPINTLKMTYFSGPYEDIDMFLIKDQKSMASLLKHFQFYTTIHQHTHPGKTTGIGAGIGAGIGGLSSLTDIGTFYKDSIRNNVYSYIFMGSMLGLIVSALRPIARYNFNNLIKQHNAIYIEKLSLGTTIELTQEQLKNANIISNEGPAESAHIYILHRMGNILHSVNDIDIDPSGTYVLAISSENALSLTKDGKINEPIVLPILEPIKEVVQLPEPQERPIEKPAEQKKENKPTTKSKPAPKKNTARRRR